MKKSEIVRGKKYKHENHPNTIYLGISKFESFPSHNTKKDLIIISKNQWNGSIVQAPTSDKKFWNGFYPVKK